MRNRAYWVKQDREARLAAMPQSRFRKKANEYMNLIQETANLFSEIGGEIVIIGGNLAAQSTNFFWAMGKGAQEFIKDYEALSLSLYNHFCGRMSAAYIQANAAKLQLALEERLQQPGETGETTVPLRSVDAQMVTSVNRQRQQQVRAILQILPRDSTVTMYTKTGSLTPNFWDTHIITHWPVSIPTFLNKRLTSWTTSLCDSFLQAYDRIGTSWMIVQSSNAHGMKDATNLSSKR